MTGALIEIYAGIERAFGWLVDRFKAAFVRLRPRPRCPRCGERL